VTGTTGCTWCLMSQPNDEENWQWFPGWEQREAERLAGLVRADKQRQAWQARAVRARAEGWVPVDEFLHADGT
jgi:hypothetical protein